MIYYFSATGNCKHVAESIAGALNDKAVSILELSDGDYAPEKTDVLGVVVPTYAWGLPDLVLEFLDRLKIKEKPEYSFFLATYGTTPGNAARLAAKRISFDACYSVKMPDTWTVIFDLSDKEKVDKLNQAADAEIRERIEQIKERKKGNFTRNRIPAFTEIFYRPYYDNMRRSDHFHVEDSCIGCGLCERKCPAHAIEMKDKKPVWTKKRCTMCLGCLHRCPKFAIQYGNSTKKHGQYTNPNVRV